MTGQDCRTAQQIGERALLSGITLAAMRPPGLEGNDRGEMMRVATPALRARDREILTSKHWSRELVEELAWQCEPLHVLLWAVNRQPSLLPVDAQIDGGVVVGEINAMARDANGWMRALVLRPRSELDAAEAWLDLWLWRVREGDVSGRRLTPAAEAAIRGALDRGVLARAEVLEGDVRAFGRPFHTLAPEARGRVARIVEERVRAIRWIWNDFEDWWEPDLDS